MKYLTGFFFVLALIVAGISCTNTITVTPSAPSSPPSGCTAYPTVTVPDQYLAPPATLPASNFYVIRTQADWNNYCSAYNPVPPPPVNLNQYMILIYSEFSGSCCADSVAIKQVCDFPGYLEVQYNFLSGGANFACQSLSCVATVCLINVKSAVAVPQSSLPVSWVANDLCPAPTPYPNPPSSGIYWADASVTFGQGSSGGSQEVLLVQSVNGQAEATDVVTLQGMGAGGPVWSLQLNYVSSNGPYAYYVASQFPADDEPLYVLTSQTSQGTATATVVAPGPPILAANGSQASWSPEGNLDRVRVWRYVDITQTFDSAAGSADVDSPFTLPASAYPTSGGVTYYLQADTVNQTSTVTGAAAGSVFRAATSAGQNILK